MVDNQRVNNVLSFRENIQDRLRNTSNRVRNLAPQIRSYRKDGFGWPIIHTSLQAAGIHLKIQSIKNLVSSYKDEPKTEAILAHSSYIELEPSNTRSFNL